MTWLEFICLCLHSNKISNTDPSSFLYVLLFHFRLQNIFISFDAFLLKKKPDPIERIPSVFQPTLKKDFYHCFVTVCARSPLIIMNAERKCDSHLQNYYNSFATILCCRVRQKHYLESLGMVPPFFVASAKDEAMKEIFAIRLR